MPSLWTFTSHYSSGNFTSYDAGISFQFVFSTQVPCDLCPPPALHILGDIELPPALRHEEGRQEEGQAGDQHHG